MAIIDARHKVRTKTYGKMTKGIADKLHGHAGQFVDIKSQVAQWQQRQIVQTRVQDRHQAHEVCLEILQEPARQLYQSNLEVNWSQWKVQR